MINLRPRKPEPKTDNIVDLTDLLMSSVRAMSEMTTAQAASACAELAGKLRSQGADSEQVRAILRDVVYQGNDQLAEALMTYLARFGFGSGAVTVQQPERIKPESTAPTLCSTNLLRELVQEPEAYSALLLSDKSVGSTTLIKALIAAYLSHSHQTGRIQIVDLYGALSWAGLSQVEGAVLNLPPRDPKFLDYLSSVVGEIAREIQSRAALRSLNQRTPRLGRVSYQPILLVVDGWNQVTEALSLMTNNQINNHQQTSQLLKDMRYCLSSGAKYAVTVILSADRLDNCCLSETALDECRIFALGAVRPGGRGGYRAIEALLENKNRLPDTKERSQLKQLTAQCKAEFTPVVLALSGVPRLGRYGDFREPELNLKRLYEERRRIA